VTMEQTTTQVLQRIKSLGFATSMVGYCELYAIAGGNFVARARVGVHGPSAAALSGVAYGRKVKASGNSCASENVPTWSTIITALGSANSART
jgi:hypothetical protein